MPKTPVHEDGNFCLVVHEGERNRALDDWRPETPGYKAEKIKQQKDPINRTLKAAGLESELLVQAVWKWPEKESGHP